MLCHNRRCWYFCKRQANTLQSDVFFSKLPNFSSKRTREKKTVKKASVLLQGCISRLEAGGEPQCNTALFNYLLCALHARMGAKRTQKAFFFLIFKGSHFACYVHKVWFDLIDCGENNVALQLGWILRLKYEMWKPVNYRTYSALCRLWCGRWSAPFLTLFAFHQCGFFTKHLHSQRRRSLLQVGQ